MKKFFRGLAMIVCLSILLSLCGCGTGGKVTGAYMSVHDLDSTYNRLPYMFVIYSDGTVAVCPNYDKYYFMDHKSKPMEISHGWDDEDWTSFMEEHTWDESQKAYVAKHENLTSTLKQISPDPDFFTGLTRGEAYEIYLGLK